MTTDAGHTPWLLRIVDGRSALAVGLIVGALVIGLGWIDYLTGWELSFSIFYMVPVALGSWRGGARMAVLLSLVCGLSWLLADQLSGHEYSREWIAYWNAAVRTGMFLALGLTLAALSTALRRAHQLARVDMLTGLANVRAFHEALSYHLESATRHRDPLTLAILDLDQFKLVNDEHGHDAGDTALGDVADALRETVRKVDLTARLGGDEFVVLLPRTDEEGARQALEKVRHAIEEAMRRRDWPVTASIGAVSCHGRVLPGELLRAGDAMLYQAKKAGGNRVLTRALQTARV